MFTKWLNVRVAKNWMIPAEFNDPCRACTVQLTCIIFWIANRALRNHPWLKNFFSSTAGASQLSESQQGSTELSMLEILFSPSPVICILFVCVLYICVVVFLINCVCFQKNSYKNPWCISCLDRWGCKIKERKKDFRYIFLGIGDCWIYSTASELVLSRYYEGRIFIGLIL